MSAPPDTAGVRTPPLKSLIFKDSGFALSKIYQCSVFRSIEGASRGTPGGGSPTLRAAPPPPPKAPQRGVIRPPKGRGRAAPLSALRAPLRPPGAPLRGSPGFAGSPSCPCSATEGGKRSAQGRQPRRGVGKKSKWWRRSRPPGRRQWKCGEGRAAGGQGWGQPVGNPPGCPRGVPASVHGPRSAGRSRSDLHISTARGSFPAPSGGLFCPAGLTTSVQEV